jgi:hypothetical protein
MGFCMLNSPNRRFPARAETVEAVVSRLAQCTHHGFAVVQRGAGERMTPVRWDTDRPDTFGDTSGERGAFGENGAGTPAEAMPEGVGMEPFRGLILRHELRLLLASRRFYVRADEASAADTSRASIAVRTLTAPFVSLHERSSSERAGEPAGARGRRRPAVTAFKGATAITAGDVALGRRGGWNRWRGRGAPATDR